MEFFFHDMLSQSELRKKYNYQGPFTLDQKGFVIVTIGKVHSTYKEFISKESPFNLDPILNVENRTRNLISQFNYHDLVRLGVVPDIHVDVEIKRYPPWVYSFAKQNPNIFSMFGLFMEEVMFLSFCPEKEIDYQNIWAMTTCHATEERLPDSEIKGNYLKGVTNWARKLGKDIPLRNVEYSIGEITGHPDLVWKSGDKVEIVDVKTNTKAKHESCLQILTYCALARTMGYSCDRIGLLMPLQRQLVYFDVGDWDESVFVSLLKRESYWVNDDRRTINPVEAYIHSLNAPMDAPLILNLTNPIDVMFQMFPSDLLGRHMLKENVISGHLKGKKSPMQIFLARPRSKKEMFTKKELVALSSQLDERNTVFVHAPYIINLCSRESDEKGSPPWGVERLIIELEASLKIRVKGVVVHVGKYKTQDIQVATDLQEVSIREAIDRAGKECPLLLETPAGEGTELLANIFDFLSFYDRFNAEERTRFKICIDTAHVFGAGYDPGYYLSTCLKYFPDSVALVHFNDSRAIRGSRKDQHKTPGFGYIGYQRMKVVHDLCVTHNIPMIIE